MESLKRLLFVWMLAVGSTMGLKAFSNVGFRGSDHFIQVEIEGDVNVPENDMFQFFLRKKIGETEPLLLNKTKLGRPVLNAALKQLGEEIQKESDETKRIKLTKLYRELAVMLEQSFRSEFLILEYTEALLKCIQAADAKAAASLDQVKKKLDQIELK